MSWHKVTLPLLGEIDPQVVEIGRWVYDIYVEENKPEGFAMLHATRGSVKGLDDKMLVYLSPVATELCRETVSEKYQLEPCGVPACNEPDVAFVFGDPAVLSQLKEKFEPEPGTVEWDQQQEALRKAQEDEELQARWEAEQAALAEAAAAEAQAEQTRVESAKSNGN